jgi:hypothetical protein
MDREKRKGEKLDWQNLDGRRAFKTTLVGSAIGGVGGYLYYSKIKLQMKKNYLSILTNFLRKVLTGENIKMIQLTLERF